MAPAFKIKIHAQRRTNRMQCPNYDFGLRAVTGATHDVETNASIGILIFFIFSIFSIKFETYTCIFKPLGKKTQTKKNGNRFIKHRHFVDFVFHFM